MPSGLRLDNTALGGNTPGGKQDNISRRTDQPRHFRLKVHNAKEPAANSDYYEQERSSQYPFIVVILAQHPSAPPACPRFHYYTLTSS